MDLNSQQFKDLLKESREASQEEMEYFGHESLDPDGRCVGGCYVASEVIHVKTDWPIRTGLVLNDQDEFVESGPDFWHSRKEFREERQRKPELRYSRADLEQNRVSPTVLDEEEHVWVETPEGTIVDPTGDQFGGPPGPRIIPQGDPRRSRYWEFQF